MLVTFSSKNTTSVLMLSRHACIVLGAAGKMTAANLPERGVFTLEQIPDVLISIEKAVAAIPVTNYSDADNDAPPVPFMTREVGFAQRTFPLLNLFRHAQVTGDSVMWELSYGY